MATANLQASKDIFSRSRPGDRVAPARRFIVWSGGLAAGVAWLAAAAVTRRWPDLDLGAYSDTGRFALIEATLGAVLLILAVGGRPLAPSFAGSGAAPPG